MVNIGVIGYGYWGPNIVRNFNGAEGARVVSICDKSQAALNRAGKMYPGIDITREYLEILTSKNIDAAAIITPVSTHFALAKTAFRKREKYICRKAVHRHGGAGRRTDRPG